MVCEMKLLYAFHCDELKYVHGGGLHWGALPGVGMVYDTYNVSNIFVDVYANSSLLYDGKEIVCHY